MIHNFHQISIRGRYIYCYLCLRNAIEYRSLEDIPDFAKVILKSFTNSSRLDDWQGEADEIMPSHLMDEGYGMELFKITSYQQIQELKRYYTKNGLAAEIIEELIWLGISNLYGGFNSKNTFECVENVLSLMDNNNIDLPDFGRISMCSVNEQGGWGNLVDIDEFVKD